MTARHAFSLIELIAVMVLVAVLMAMTAPALRGFSEHQEARNTAASILASIHWTHRKAITDGIPYRLEFDLTEREIQFTRRPNFNFEPIAHHDAQTQSWEPQVTVEFDESSDDQQITFHPDGSSTDATILVSGRGDTRLAITRTQDSRRYEIINESDLESQ